MNKYESKFRLNISVSNKKRIASFPFYYYIILFAIVYLATGAISKFESLDLFSWIEDSERYLSTYKSLGDLISFCLSNSIDFIYQSMVYITAKYTISLNLVTAVIVTFYFYLIIRMMERESSRKIDLLMLLLALFTTPITWTVAISRNLMAVMFIYLGLFCYFKNKKYLMVAFMVIGIFTHFSVLIYVAVILLALYFSKRQLHSSTVFIILGIVTVSSLMTTTLVSGIINAFAIRYETRYSAYTDMNTENFMLASTINYGDKLPVLFALFLSIYLLAKSKFTGFSFWGLFFLTIMLLFFITTRFFLINRCMLIMPLFWGLNIAQIYRGGSLKDKNQLRLIALVGVIPILLHLFSYRNHYFSFLS